VLKLLKIFFQIWQLKIEKKTFFSPLGKENLAFHKNSSRKMTLFGFKTTSIFSPIFQTIIFSPFAHNFFFLAS
jgi:hypothetical protein